MQFHYLRGLAQNRSSSLTLIKIRFFHTVKNQQSILQSHQIAKQAENSKFQFEPGTNLLTEFSSLVINQPTALPGLPANIKQPNSPDEETLHSGMNLGKFRFRTTIFTF